MPASLLKDARYRKTNHQNKATGRNNAAVSHSRVEPKPPKANPVAGVAVPSGAVIALDTPPNPPKLGIADDVPNPPNMAENAVKAQGVNMGVPRNAHTMSTHVLVPALLLRSFRMQIPQMLSVRTTRMITRHTQRL